MPTRATRCSRKTACTRWRCATASHDTLRVIGCVRECLVATEDPGAVLDRIAAPDTRIVSLTITEKGYLQDLGHRRAAARPRRHRARPRACRRAAQRAGLHRARPGPATLAWARSDHAGVAGQPAGQRAAPARRRARAGRSDRRRPGPLDRRRLQLSRQHGRPHRAAHHRRRPSGASRRAGPSRRLAGDRRALRRLGRRRPLRRRPPGLGRGRCTLRRRRRPRASA